MIACIAEDYALGKNGELLFNIKSDMKRFKDATIGKVVVMGRKTYESLPEKFRPLPNRKNIVISRNKDSVKENSVTVVSGEEELFDFIRNEGIDTNNVFIIGGGSIYKKFLPFVDEILLTRVNQITEGCDTYFPIFETDVDWKLSSIEHFSENGVDFSFEIWKHTH